MKKLIIVNVSERSELLLNVTIPDYVICTVMDEEFRHWNQNRTIPVYSYEKGIQLYKDGVVDGFLVLSSSKPYLNRKIVTRLSLKGVSIEDIYYVEEKFFTTRNNISICSFMDRRDLDYIECQIVDFCNLNCLSCLHYSPLVKKREFPDKDRVLKGFVLLKKYYQNVMNIRIMGGEPLLNPDLAWYCNELRQLFPDSNIAVVTNGLLLQQLSADILEVFRNNRIIIDISYYPVLASQIDDIHHMLEQQGIEHKISKLITYFRKIGDFQSNGNDPKYIHDNCPSRYSTCLKYSMISSCFLPFVTEYLNEYYALQLPENEGIDLERESLITREINSFLDSELQRCAYCTNKWKGEKNNWQCCNNNMSIPLNGFQFTEDDNR